MQKSFGVDILNSRNLKKKLKKNSKTFTDGQFNYTIPQKNSTKYELE